jgi:Tfp pilus assembly protein PilF
MPKNFENLRCLIGYLKVLGLLTSLTLGSFACQTSGSDGLDTETREKAVLESQKALVRNALDTGKPESAHKNLRELLERYPEDASLNNLMGLTQLALKNTERAIRYFQLAYKEDPQVGTGLNLSSALIEAGDYSRAEKTLKSLTKEAIKTKYRYKERIAHNLGYCAFKQGNQIKSEVWYKKALEENPTFFPSHLELARLYESTGRPSLAMARYRQVIDYCRTCLEPVEALTGLLVTQGRPQEAKRLLTQFLKNEELLDTDRQKATTLLSNLPFRPASSASLPYSVPSNSRSQQ